MADTAKADPNLINAIKALTVAVNNKVKIDSEIEKGLRRLNENIIKLNERLRGSEAQ